jgi:dephospho-CoA kinase
MFKIGLTGNIGSGKTYIASIFEHLGIPVFNADNEAKTVYTLPEIIRAVAYKFPQVVQAKDIDLKRLSNIVFNNKMALAELNALIHPKVIEKFDIFCKNHLDASYILFESAIIFEAKLSVLFDKIIGVKADKFHCFTRVKERCVPVETDFEKRWAMQIPVLEKMRSCDYLIYNEYDTPILNQILEIDQKIRTL